ncbi:hypothetical protein P7K49_007881 [Saguinus oedipus]|uniref:Uncharacterized protein n=1 Tax=Saguinus oedipus TaxID=9490 RepID=A0ABQ9VW50_SAGOE|nr:hypothetical protein P7K49_007881 [Saguinus oedipus]
MTEIPEGLTGGREQTKVATWKGEPGSPLQLQTEKEKGQGGEPGTRKMRRRPTSGIWKPGKEEAEERGRDAERLGLERGAGKKNKAQESGVGKGGDKRKTRERSEDGGSRQLTRAAGEAGLGAAESRRRPFGQ